jgi:hypothetical protein
MKEVPHVWLPNWNNRVFQAVRELGFPSLTAYLATVPSVTYDELAKRLGNFAPVQIVDAQFEEARALNCVRAAAMDSLCRELAEELPEGWGIGEDADWQSVHALSSWSSEITVTGECEEFDSTTMEIARALRALPPPTGWFPVGPDDPIIVAIFDSKWPVGA